MKSELTYFMTHESGFRGHEKFRTHLLRPQYINEVINIIQDP